MRTISSQRSIVWGTCGALGAGKMGEVTAKALADIRQLFARISFRVRVSPVAAVSLQ